VGLISPCTATHSGLLCLSQLVSQKGFIIMGSNWTYCHLPTYANSKLIRINKSSQYWLFLMPLDVTVYWQCQWTSMTLKSRDLDQWKLQDNKIRYVESITLPWNTIRQCPVNFPSGKELHRNVFHPDDRRSLAPLLRHVYTLATMATIAHRAHRALNRTVYM
jgi:hypothetical protein